MRFAAGLLALTLAGCQSSPIPSTATAPPPVPVATSSAAEVIPPAPRRPLARLNPRRQRLEVGEAPQPPRPRTRKVGVRVVSPAPEASILPPAPRVNPPIYSAPPVQTPSARIEHPSVPVQSWPPPALAQAWMAQEQERIRQNNEMLMNRPLPGGGMTPEMQHIAYPQANLQRMGPSAAHQAAERRYLEARADFLNTKYLPDGTPPRYTPDNVRGMVGTGMPLAPTLMNQPAMFNPVLQKAQQAEVLRQEMQRTP